jgi:hypothetical protein
MNITFEAARHSASTGESDRTTLTSAPEITDFSEAHHRLMLEVVRTNQTAETRLRTNSPIMRVESSNRYVEVLEEAFYWFVSAPALGYLGYLIFGF